MPTFPTYMGRYATLPTDLRVVNAMLPYFTVRFGNAASRHHPFGWVARDAVAVSRRHLATLIGADPRGLIFTSGATESYNLVIKGILTASSSRLLHVVTMSTERHAVLDPCSRLEREGIEVTCLAPRPDGLCALEAVERSLRPHICLVTVMMANNEFGVM